MASKQARDKAIKEATNIVRRSGLRTGVPMGQREDVQASLLAGHGVDSVARRKVADQVCAIVAAGATHAVRDAFEGSMRSHDRVEEVATAASAVVLASDLRAPHPITAELAPEGASLLIIEGEMRALGIPNRQGWRARLANVERLLSEGMDDAGTSTLPYHRMRDALAEIRTMLDGQ